MKIYFLKVIVLYLVENVLVITSKSLFVGQFIFYDLMI